MCIYKLNFQKFTPLKKLKVKIQFIHIEKEIKHAQINFFIWVCIAHFAHAVTTPLPKN